MAFFKKKKKMFGEIAVEKGLATREDIENALKIQKELLEKKSVQKVLGAILQENGVLGIDDVESVLDEQKRSESFIMKSFVYSIFHSGQPR